MNQVLNVPTQPGPAPAVEPWRAAAPPGVVGSVAGTVAATALLGGVTGPGFLAAYVIAFAMLLTVGVAVAARTGSDDRARRAQRLIVAVAGAAVLAVGAPRSAGWLCAAGLIGAGLLGSLALVGGGTGAGILRASVTTWELGVRRWPWMLRGLSDPRGRWAAGGLLALVAAALVVRSDRIGLAAVLVVVAMFTVGGHAALLERPSTDRDRSRPRLAPGRWTLWPSVVAVALIAGVLLENLLLGAGTTVSPAPAARRTFAVLVAVAVGVGIMIAAVHAKASISTRRRRLVQRLVLGITVITLFGYAALALRALDAYCATDGLTRVRMLAYAAIAFITGVYLLVAVAGIRLYGRWLPRGLVALATLVLIALAAVNPDALIARVDVDNALSSVYPTGQVVGGTGSLLYVASLSPDAVDEIDRLPEPLRSCALAATIGPVLERPDHWYDWSPGRAHARAALRRHPVDPTARCGRR